MSAFKWSRRRFIAGLGGAVGLASFLDNLVAQEEAPAAVKRFLIMQRPVGTVYENWWPQGSGADFTLSRILQQFEPLRQRMVVLRGLELPHQGSVGGGHERGTVLMATGVRTVQLYPGNGGDDPMAEGASVDQLILEQSPFLKGPPIASLQVSCDQRADTPEVSTRHMSYSGPRSPMRPYYQPLEAYQRIFGTLVPGGNADALAAARAQKKSVLDFALKDLGRMRTVAPGSQRERLDAHEEAIRELERELDADPSDPAFCGIATAPEEVEVSTRLDSYNGDHEVQQRDDEKHSRIGELHLAVIKAAFRCDLTRVVTFQWSPGTNHVSFGGLWPPNAEIFKVHHTTSHDPDSPDQLEFLTRVEEWYAQRISAFLQDLATTEDVVSANGSMLLDNIVAPYISEVGARYHNWDNMPFLLFGGPGVGLQGNQYWTAGTGRASRSTNDFWMACARALGVPDFVLGDNDQHTTAIDGLFV